MRKKKLHYTYEGKIEKSVPRDYSLSSVGKPRDAKRRSTGRIFLSYMYPHTHDGFLCSIPESQELSGFYTIQYKHSSS